MSEEADPPAPSNYHVIESTEQFQELLGKDLEVVSILYFRADWAEPCKTMDPVAKEIASKYSQTLVLEIEAEALPEISESFDVEAVPFFVVIRGHTLLKRISGAQAAVLASAVENYVKMDFNKYLSSTSESPKTPPAEESPQELEERCLKLMKQADVVLFMKGEPNQPRCGFSKETVGILRKEKIDFSHFDILNDETVRQQLKVMNDWPTFPQLIIKGEFVGGLDIVKEMVQNNELKELLTA